MANYKEEQVLGSRWQRAYRVIIDNSINKLPYITFYEEEAVSTGDDAVTRHVSHLVETFADPETTFNLIDPNTGDSVGTAKYSDLYVVVYSLYMHLANLRDNPPIVQEDIPSDTTDPSP